MLFIHFCIFVKVRQFLHVAYSRPTILFKEWIARWFWALSWMIPVAFIFIYACVTAPNTARRWRLLFQLLKFGWLIINTPSHKFKLDLRVKKDTTPISSVSAVSCCLERRLLYCVSGEKVFTGNVVSETTFFWLGQCFIPSLTGAICKCTPASAHFPHKCRQRLSQSSHCCVKSKYVKTMWAIRRTYAI